jgi:hypothetical protein
VKSTRLELDQIRLGWTKTRLGKTIFCAGRDTMIAGRKGKGPDQASATTPLLKVPTAQPARCQCAFQVPIVSRSPSCVGGVHRRRRWSPETSSKTGTEPGQDPVVGPNRTRATNAGDDYHGRCTTKVHPATGRFATYRAGRFQSRRNQPVMAGPFESETGTASRSSVDILTSTRVGMWTLDRPGVCRTIGRASTFRGVRQ